MTVGIAALAEKRGAIVLVADKQFTDVASGLRVDGHDVKAFQLKGGWIVLYAGDATFATLVINRAEAMVKDGRPVYNEAADVMHWLREAYEAVYEEEIESGLFRPRLLDRAMFTSRSYDEATIRDIEGHVEKYQEDSTCDLLACGFDADGEGQAITLGVGFADIADSYATIGHGAGFADAHFAWRGTRSSDRLPRVVYESYEAKMHAELNAYVGRTDDVLVMFGNKQDEVRLLTRDTKDLLRTTITFEDFTAFQRPEVRREGETCIARPEEWERVLTEDRLGLVIAEVARRNLARGKE